MSFEASLHFKFSKPAGKPCRNLTGDARCAIHARLRASGFPGCAAYDCYGAGQRVTQLLGGAAPAERDTAFAALRRLHELLWQLSQATRLCPATRGDLLARLAGEIAALDEVALGPVSGWLDLDWRGKREAAQRLLREVGKALGRRHGATPDRCAAISEQRRTCCSFSVDDGTGPQ
jgi:hypothetical protein